MTQSFTLSCEQASMQLDVIHGFLTTSYWAEGITPQWVAKSMENSLCFGVFCGENQVAFARVITDKTTFAYLADVFVLQEYRSQGLSKRLMEYILAHPDLQTLRRFMLCTADAHGLYRQFGFGEVSAPQTMMAIHRPGMYLQPEN